MSGFGHLRSLPQLRPQPAGGVGVDGQPTLYDCSCTLYLLSVTFVYRGLKTVVELLQWERHAADESADWAASSKGRI